MIEALKPTADETATRMPKTGALGRSLLACPLGPAALEFSRPAAMAQPITTGETQMLNDTQTDKIHSLNDSLRRNLSLAVTSCLPRGMTCLEPDRLAELLEAVRRFDSFTRDNDPHGEHDFDAIDGNPEGAAGRAGRDVEIYGCLRYSPPTPQ
ncbi:hypothetical protein ABIB80_001540 [Bradyrhizobium sp. i1.15.2]|uniref:DUF3768 domain-containing protein n=1 Tax=Bradyrhizobium sp. i1.15.2 TaxID=3156362 RepID=UPI003398337F